jgi:hypothetical protein
MNYPCFGAVKLKLTRLSESSLLSGEANRMAAIFPGVGNI